jgi:two-component system, NarL family, response regulator NreC
MITVVIADDHKLIRDGFNKLLEGDPLISVIGETGDGLECVRITEGINPDVLVVDLNMPGLSGFEVIRQIQRRRPRIRIIVLSMFCQQAYVKRAMQYGASAFVVKDDGFDSLVTAVKDVMAGRVFLSPSVLGRVDFEKDDRTDSDDPYESLTEREREILYLIAEGFGSPEIADRLFISKRTVDKHRSNLMEKLDIHNERTLVRYAIEHGLVFPSGQSDMEAMENRPSSEMIRTLVVDDNDEFRNQLVRFLTTLGFFDIVGSAANSNDAIAAAGQFQPDLVLLDIRMKPVDGISALPDLIAASPDTNYVILTLLNEQVYSDRARQAGATGYVPKSRLLDGLIPTLRDIFGTKRIPPDREVL